MGTAHSSRLMSEPRPEEIVIQKRREKLNTLEEKRAKEAQRKANRQQRKEMTAKPPASFLKTYGMQMKFERNLRLARQTAKEEPQ